MPLMYYTNENSDLNVVRPHFIIVEKESTHRWQECQKHNDAYQQAIGCIGFGMDEDCIGCVVEDGIIEQLNTFNTCECSEDDPNPKHYRCGAMQGLIPRDILALIQGEHK